MNELKRRAAYHRKRLNGLSPFCSLGESAVSDITVYNGTNDEAFDYSTVDLNNSQEIGLHCGTEQACRDRGYKFINKLSVKSPKVLQLPFDVTTIWSSIEFVRLLARFELFDEKQLESLENQMRKCADVPNKYHKYSALLREFFLGKGYNVISYVNEIEDPGSTSYILLDMSIVHSDFEEGFNMRLDRKSIDKNRIDIARLLGIPAFSILIHENGRFEIHNISEDDARRYSNILRNKVKDIRLIPGKYEFKKIPMPGQMPDRLVTISGILKESLNEGHQIQEYKGYELDWNDDNVDPEEGIADFTVYIKKNGKELAGKNGSVLTFNGFKEARKYVDSIATPCSAYDKSRQIKALIDSSTGGDTVSLTKSGNKSISVIYSGHSSHQEYYRWYLTDDFRYSLIRYDNISPSDYRGEYYPDEDKEWVSSHLGFTIEDDINDDDEAPALILKYVLTHPLEETPFADTGIGLDNFIDALDKYYGLLGVNGVNQEAIDRLKDEYDCSIPTELTEGKRKKKGIYLNKDAGNVEHNIKMFNHMNTPTESPSTNPISGPMGGNVGGTAMSTSCCESVSNNEIPRGKFVIDRNIISENDLPGKIVLTDNGAFDLEAKGKSGRYIWIGYSHGRGATEYRMHPIVKEVAYKIAKLFEKKYKKQATIDNFLSTTDMMRVYVENDDINEGVTDKFYSAKYRGVNTDKLHKVYFRCEGDIADAENLLDELIAEPYTDARVLGTVSKAAAEKDGFTKIGGTDNKELDDDFNMSTRTLW